MTRRLLAGFLAALCLLPATGCAMSHVNARYIRFTDESIVTHKGLDIAPPDPWAGTSLKLQVEYSGPGILPSRPEKVTVAILSTARTSPYKDNHRMELAADGDVLESREAGYDPTVRAGMLVEYMWVKLPTPIFVALANAKQVRGSIGPTAFALTPEQQAEWKDLADHIWPERKQNLLDSLPFKLPNIHL
jgi:hypothetical protein